MVFGIQHFNHNDDGYDGWNPTHVGGLRDVVLIRCCFLFLSNPTADVFRFLVRVLVLGNLYIWSLSLNLLSNSVLIIECFVKFYTKNSNFVKFSTNKYDLSNSILIIVCFMKFSTNI